MNWLPAKNVTTHLREVMTPRKGYVWEKNNIPANGKAIWNHLEKLIHLKLLQLTKFIHNTILKLGTKTLSAYYPILQILYLNVKDWIILYWKCQNIKVTL